MCIQYVLPVCLTSCGGGGGGGKPGGVTSSMFAAWETRVAFGVLGYASGLFHSHYFFYGCMPTPVVEVLCHSQDRLLIVLILRFWPLRLF